MDICKTDVQKIIKYFDDAAKVYDTMPGQRNNCRAWVIRQMIKKLENKLFTFNSVKNDDKLFPFDSPIRKDNGNRTQQDSKLTVSF